MNIPDTQGLCVDDALSYIGVKYSTFSEGLATSKERIGQAWFSALDPEDQEKLRGTLYDPFHADAWNFVLQALAYLLKN